MMAKKKKPRVVLFGGFLLLILLACAGVTAARYMMKNSQSGVVAAKEFYFTSDLLRESEKAAIYYIDPKAETFSIRLFNYADPQRTAPDQIAYSVEAENGVAEVTPASGTLPGGAQNEAVITVTPAAGSQEDITVTATSKAPYQKTLQAIFRRSLGNRYTVSDQPGNTAAVLTMTCADSGGNVAIALPSGVIADQADSRIAYANGTSYMFAAPGSGVYSVVLLKTDTGKDLSGSGQFANTIDIQ